MAQNNPEPSFNAPIPGMSLTTEPGNRPWEQPPQYADVEDVIEFYLGRFEQDEKVDKMFYYLEMGIPVNSLVQTMLTNGAMTGVHTIESGLLAGPVISEYIQAVAEIEGVEFTVSSDDLTKDNLSPEDAKRLKRMMMQQIDENYGEDGVSPGVGEMEDSMEEEPRQSIGGSGLMARRMPQEAEQEEPMMESEMTEEQL